MDVGDKYEMNKETGQGNTWQSRLRGTLRWEKGTYKRVKAINTSSEIQSPYHSKA